MKVSLRLFVILTVLNSAFSFAQGFVQFNNFSGGILSVGGEPIEAGWRVELVRDGQILATGETIGFGFFDGGIVEVGPTGGAYDLEVRWWCPLVADSFEAAGVGRLGTDPETGLEIFAPSGSQMVSVFAGDVQGIPPELPGTLNFPGGDHSFAAEVVYYRGVCIPEPQTLALWIAAVSLLGLGLGRRGRCVV